MYLLMRNNEPVGIFVRTEDLFRQIEDRISTDYAAFKTTNLYNQEQFPLFEYLDMKILIVAKETIGWVRPDFVENEVYVFEFLNAENSNIIKMIDDYNESLIYG